MSRLFTVICLLLFCLPTFAAVEVQTVHVLQELRSRGCDIWHPSSLGCQSATMRYCIDHGYAGGYGPIEWSRNTATVNCLGRDVADYKEFVYAGECSSRNPVSLYCRSQALRQCLSAGYVGSVGVTEANQKVIGTLCLKSESRAGLVSTNLNELQATNPEAGCTREGVIQGSAACQNASHRVCAAKGFSTGFNVSEYDGSNVLQLNCVSAIEKETDVRRSPQFGDLVRAIRIGTMVMGGPDQESGGTATAADVVYNAFDFPIVITNVNLFTTFTLSSDNCFYLNQGGIWQVNGSWDGETMCVGPSGSSDIVSMNYGQFGRGVLLNPGDRLTFQATTPSGAGNYNFAMVTFAKVDKNIIPVRRMRFPRWDAQYMVAGNSTIKVPTGCQDANCPAIPMEKNGPNNLQQSSNFWFVAPIATQIRGLTIYDGSLVGVIKGTLRVARQGGANLATFPFQFEGGSKKESFDKWFGKRQKGSSFIPLDIDVPAGALVGIDFELINPTLLPTGIDFAGYVWFDQRVPFTPPKDY